MGMFKEYTSDSRISRWQEWDSTICSDLLMPFPMLQLEIQLRNKHGLCCTMHGLPTKRTTLSPLWGPSSHEDDSKVFIDPRMISQATIRICFFSSITTLCFITKSQNCIDTTNMAIILSDSWITMVSTSHHITILVRFMPINYTQMLHVWNIYLHLPQKSLKCR